MADQFTDGFGLLPFGDFPFGKGDWAESVTNAAIPEIYREKDRDQTNPELPLQTFYDAVKNSLEPLLDKVLQLSDLKHPLRIPENVLAFLARSYGVVLDDTKSTRFQRSQVFFARQKFLKKGQDRGYEIAGLQENLEVDVQGLWENPCDSGNLQTAGPQTFTALYDRVPGDVIPCDEVFTDDLELAQDVEDAVVVAPAGVKIDTRLEPDPNVCRTHLLRISMTRSDILDPSDIILGSTFTKIREGLERVKPIHVEFERVELVTVLEAEFEPTAELDMSTEFTLKAHFFHQYDEAQADVFPADGGLQANLEIV